MSDNSLTVDTDALRGCAPSFASLGDRLVDILDNLTSRLDAEGECWGADETGASFLEGYAEGRDAALEFLPQMADGVRGVGDGLITMADNYDGVETTNTPVYGV